MRNTAPWLAGLALIWSCSSLSAQDYLPIRQAKAYLGQPEPTSPELPAVAPKADAPKTVQPLVLPVIEARGVSESCTPTCNRNGGLQAGAGVYYLSPHWGDVTAWTVTTTSAPTAPAAMPGAIISANNQDLDFHAAYAPRIWLGYTCDDGFGVRGAWWRLVDNSPVLQTAVQPNNGGTTQRLVIPSIKSASDDVLTAGFGIPRQGVLVVDSGIPNGLAATVSVFGRLELMVADIELTQQFQCQNWTVLAGAGARYAHIRQTMNANTTSFAPAGGGGFSTISQSLLLANRYDGAGPEFFLEGRRALRWGFGVYGNLRGGILFGVDHLTHQQTANVTSPTGIVTLFIPYNRQANPDATVPFGEIEAGIDWSANLRFVSPTFRMGVVGQHWFNTGSPTSTINNKTGDLSLFGFQLSAGIKY